MKKLADDLKRALSGLAAQDASEFLSTREKMGVLGGYARKVQDKPSTPSLRVVKKPETRRIALISDGRGLGAPLDYAIETCARQNAKIDLLIHGLVDVINISVLENRIYEAGLEYHSTQLGTDAVEGISQYISQHPSLIFMVAMPDDPVAKVLIEDVIPKRYNRLPVPMVLIEDHTSVLSSKRPIRHLTP